eukprot:CAMPEP_0178378596 /NCGR_PEP_ID=MMETSP0689_2-20121128/4511_1 /TAXON_ID=160604 /ORGANISM="Amphidinium massartii, Strain CS-259" /LENGTH=211 /DNA_ID=CAMNT_0019998677 /DNA_START=44 /DNA_END=676 /DNA_ORIENTATION=-
MLSLLGRRVATRTSSAAATSLSSNFVNLVGIGASPTANSGSCLANNAAHPPNAALLGSVRGIAKYWRFGFWARGPKDGRYTTRDPRIFRHTLRRKYPFFKERRWSKPYIGKNFTLATPFGSAIQLVILQKQWEHAKAYYLLRNALQAALPAAKIARSEFEEATAALGLKNDALDGSPLQVIRATDGRHLMSFSAADVNDIEHFDKVLQEKF